MKKAHDKEVTWQVTWCDVTSLEHGRMAWNVKIAEGGLNFYLPLSFLFYFLFHFRSIFLFLELGLGLSDKDHTVTWQVTSDDMVTSHMTQRRT